MLQPRDIFAGVIKESIDILELPNTPSLRFWVVPIDEYADFLKTQINKQKSLNANAKKYLSVLVDYATGDITSIPTVENAFKLSKLPPNQVAKDFGELLAPFYGVKYLNQYMTKNGVRLSKGSIRSAYGAPGKKLNAICFPDAQNYPLFDFFIQNGYYFGFSVKAMAGGTNTLSPTYVLQRLEQLNPRSKVQLKKDYPLEFGVLEILGREKSMAGPVKAFGAVLETKGSHFADIDKMRTLFRKTDFEKDASIIEKNKGVTLDKLGLSDYGAYNKFLNDYILDSVSVPDVDKKKYRNGTKEYDTINVVSSFIRYLAKIKYDLSPMLRELFPDLNILKVGISSKGIPDFKLVTIIKAENTITESSFDLRSKASFGRVDDKLGIQL